MCAARADLNRVGAGSENEIGGDHLAAASSTTAKLIAVVSGTTAAAAAHDEDLGEAAARDGERAGVRRRVREGPDGVGAVLHDRIGRVRTAFGPVVERPEREIRDGGGVRSVVKHDVQRVVRGGFEARDRDEVRCVSRRRGKGRRGRRAGDGVAVGIEDLDADRRRAAAAGDDDEREVCAVLRECEDAEVGRLRRRGVGLADEVRPDGDLPGDRIGRLEERIRGRVRQIRRVERHYVCVDAARPAHKRDVERFAGDDRRGIRRNAEDDLVVRRAALAELIGVRRIRAYRRLEPAALGHLEVDVLRIDAAVGRLCDKPLANLKDRIGSADDQRRLVAEAAAAQTHGTVVAVVVGL